MGYRRLALVLLVLPMSIVLAGRQTHAGVPESGTVPSAVAPQAADGSKHVRSLSPSQKKKLAEAQLLEAEAMQLSAAGQHGAGVEIARRVLELYELVLGPEHPDVAMSLNNLGALLAAKGDYAGAEPLLRRCLAIREKALGPEHPDVAQSLNNLGQLLAAKGDDAGAERLHRRSLAISEKALGPEHPDVATRLAILAGHLYAKGDYAGAERLWRRSLAIREKALGPEHPDVATSLNNLVGFLLAKGDDAGAERLWRRSLATVEKALGPEHPDVATRLVILGGLLAAKGDDAGAERLHRRSLAIREKALGPEHPDVATSLYHLGGLLHAKGDDAGAERLLRRCLAIREKALGPEHPDVATSLDRLAGLLHAKGDYAGPERFLRRSLAVREKALGPEHPDVATSLNNLGGLLLAKGDDAGAERLHRRSLAILEKALGPEHPDVATSLNNLGGLLLAKGDFAGAERLHRRSLAIREKALGPEHPDVMTSLNNLGGLLLAKGDYAGAERLLRRSLAIAEKAFGPEHPAVAASLNNLGGLLRAKGDYAGAERLWRRSLAVREKALGPEHPDVAQSLDNLGGLLLAKGDYAEAEPLLRRTLAIGEKALGPELRDVAQGLSNLAALLHAKGDEAGAERLHRRSLAIGEKDLGPEHPDVAQSLTHLAALLQARGDYAGAERLHRRSLAIGEKALGPEHPDVAQSLSNLAALLQAKGDSTGALPLLLRGLSIEESNVREGLLDTGDSRRVRAYLQTLRDATYGAISFHAMSPAPVAGSLELALGTLLRRKGLVEEASRARVHGLVTRGEAEDRAQLKELAGKRSALSALVRWRPSGAEAPEANGERLEGLRKEAEALERSLSVRYAELGIAQLPVTVASVRAALPEGSALVEYAVFPPFFPKKKGAARWGEPEYVAYVLPAVGEAGFARLGSARLIESAVLSLRELMVAEAPPEEVYSAARELDELIMAPVRQLLGESRDLYVSPDGALSLVPFAALMDEQRRFLLQSYRINVLTSGRDVLRFAIQQRAAESQRGRAKSGPLVMGAPEYGPATGVGSVEELDGAYAEAELVADLLTGELPPQGPVNPGVTSTVSLRKEKATEWTVKSRSAPRMLHLATHAYFLPNEEGVKAPRASPGGVATTGGLPVVAGGNPMRQSGLALAGFNQRKSRGGEREDGDLTAEEVSGLNLWGTQLVVLSACDTAVGKVSNGDGVYGLRRALVLAGSETQVTTLWQMDDGGGAGLMADYYSRLKQGTGRVEALRLAQLKVLGEKETSHPYYWASFIASGNPSSLSYAPAHREVRQMGGTAAEPMRLQERPGGCGCRVLGGDAPALPGQLAWLALGALALRWRWRQLPTAS